MGPPVLDPAAFWARLGAFHEKPMSTPLMRTQPHQLQCYCLKIQFVVQDSTSFLLISKLSDTDAYLCSAESLLTRPVTGPAGRTKDVALKSCVSRRPEAPQKDLKASGVVPLFRLCGYSGTSHEDRVPQSGPSEAGIHSGILVLR